jgi:uncharacterized protein YndB with AHSA1/START domain
MSERTSNGSTRTLEAETSVDAPIGDVFDLLVDVPRYVAYSKYLQSVEADGDGGPGTIYRLRFEWWRLSYTAVSRVEGIDRPRRIDWRVVKDVDARGSWQLTPVGGADDETETAADGDVPEEDGAAATRVTIGVEYDPDSATPGILDLPRFVSLDRVVERATPLVEREARRVLERLVADLEGEARPIDLTVRHG